jgi:rubrerythrin
LLIAAGQEFVHKDKFQSIYNDLSKGKEADYNYLFDEETTSYLRVLIENQVFIKKDQPSGEGWNLKDALEYAVKSENHTIEVYTKMYSGITNNEVKKVLAELIEEEKTHAEYFQKLADELA